MQKHEMKKQDGEQWYAGSMTVEAAIGIPVLVYVLLAVVYLNFWQYDRMVTQAYCTLAAWQMQYELQAKEQMSGRLGEKLVQGLLTDVLEQTVCTKHMLYSQAECSLRMEIPLSGIPVWAGMATGYQKTCRGIVAHGVTASVFRNLCNTGKGEETV